MPLTYAEFKEAEELALKTSRSVRGAPVAIVTNAAVPWWDFSTKGWKVVLHTPDIAEDTIIVGGIVARPGRS